MGSAGDTVFVIDDDAALVKVVSLALNLEGYEVYSFTSPLEALVRLASDSPLQLSAIVLDLNMPEMDGQQFFKASRQGGYENPVLIVSEYGARKAHQELGAEAYLQKPFDPLGLASKLRDMQEGLVEAKRWVPTL